MPRKTHAKQPILVPVDFSPASEAALRFAAGLAKALHAPLAVLHVVHDPGDAPGYYAVRGRKKQLRRMEDVAREMLDGFVDKAIDEAPALEVLQRAERRLAVGLPVGRIMEMVDKLGARMVVMGSTGRSALDRLLLGSKAEQAVHVCPVPITIVPAAPPAEPDPR